MHYLISRNYFSSDVGFTNIVVQSMAQSGAGMETKYGVPAATTMIIVLQVVQQLAKCT